MDQSVPSTQSSSIAHNLESNIWRSKDVNLSAYTNDINNNNSPDDHQIEIRTPLSNDKNFLLRNSNKNTTFSLMKIDTKIVNDLKRCGFIWPSPIQTLCLPIVRLGIDLIAQSKSGTGKTIVFVVSALEIICKDLNENNNEDNNDRTIYPKVLILAPTREIAVQIGDVINAITTDWKNFSCYKAIGGTKVSDDLEKLYRSQIIVGTPGRIVCLLEMNFLKPHAIRLFILDECDKLMEENFKIQIDKIYNRLPKNKQMIVTSATMTDEMTNYLSKYMHDPTLIRMNADKPSLIGVQQYTLSIDGHCLDYMNFESKIEPLCELLNTVQFNQCFIFLNYQTRVKYLYECLNKKGFSCIFITGDMTQKERLQSIEMFRSQRYKVFISTDLTSRGIDVESVNLVINLDVPINCETYLHRIGRSGRFGSSGIAITIVGNESNENEKFSKLLQQYHLETKLLHLPLTINLWDNFLYEHESNDSNIQSRKTKLKMNPLFKEIRERYEKILENPESIIEYDFCPHKTERKPLSIILLELNIKSSEQHQNEKRKSTINNVKASSIQNHYNNINDQHNRPTEINDDDDVQKCVTSSENDNSRVKSHKLDFQPNVSNINHHQSDDHQFSSHKQLRKMEKIFHQTFLNTSMIINRFNHCNKNYTKMTTTMNHHQHIFQYLLNGGGIRGKLY